MSVAAGKPHGEWIVRYGRSARPAVRLVCFPYAGGAASAYRLWPEGLPASVDLCAVQLPGREQRHREPPLTDMPSVVRATTAAVLPLADLPLVLFGHSMGAIIAYETARTLHRQHGIVPRRLIVSGRRPPHMPATRPAMHALPATALLDEIRRLNGTPGDVLNDPEMLDIVLPIIRADFRLIETYRMADATPLTCPVAAIGGDADPDVTPAMLAGWRATTSGDFETAVFPGDHFYHQADRPGVLRLIARRLWNEIDPG